MATKFRRGDRVWAPLRVDEPSETAGATVEETPETLPSSLVPPVVREPLYSVIIDGQEMSVPRTQSQLRAFNALDLLAEIK